MKLVTDAQHQFQKGDVAGAKRNADAVLQRDPTFCRHCMSRADLLTRRQIRPGAEGLQRSAPAKIGVLWRLRLLRADINARLGNTLKR